MGQVREHPLDSMRDSRITSFLKKAGIDVSSLSDDQMLFSSEVTSNTPEARMLIAHIDEYASKRDPNSGKVYLTPEDLFGFIADTKSGQKEPLPRISMLGNSLPQDKLIPLGATIQGDPMLNSGKHTITINYVSGTENGQLVIKYPANVTISGPRISGSQLIANVSVEGKDPNEMSWQVSQQSPGESHFEFRTGNRAY